MSDQLDTIRWAPFLMIFSHLRPSPWCEQEIACSAERAAARKAKTAARKAKAAERARARREVLTPEQIREMRRAYSRTWYQKHYGGTARSDARAKALDRAKAEFAAKEARAAERAAARKAKAAEIAAAKEARAAATMQRRKAEDEARDARAAGDKTFVSSKPCRTCGMCGRYASNGHCAWCAARRNLTRTPQQQKRRASRAAWQRSYYRRKCAARKGLAFWAVP